MRSPTRCQSLNRFLIKPPALLAKIDINTMASRISYESKEKMSKKSNGQILVVDDDAMSRKILAQMLVSAGYECHESDNGAKALESIRAEQPSLLLLDFDMPGLNGAEVLKRLRTDGDPTVAQ